jgi:D-glycero-beta-D-manno-heptose-7-phosphate kinase
MWQQNISSALNNLKALVIGDVMLDTYWWGNINRISPEAPVPIIEWHHEEKRLGGASNVALNLKSLGVKTYLCSVIGNDVAGEELKTLIAKQQITLYPLIDNERPTTEKTRVISRNQQVLRIDKEKSFDLNANQEEKFIQLIGQTIQMVKPDVIIFEDYNKGALTEMVISETLKLANQLNIITTVDPKRKNFFAYKNVTIFKPNLKEIMEALQIIDLNVDKNSLHNINNLLHEHIQHSILCLTLSEKGIYYNNGSEEEILPTYAKQIADVSGAGDTVIAALSALYTITKDINISCKWANIAAGLVCEEVGTVPINKDKWLAAIQ